MAKSDQYAGDADHSRKLQQKILDISPLLEAFGNAKTCRNDNSSRFGKLVEIFVDVRSKQIQGAEIVHYLLEKSRVVKCEAGERNYHIFYALVKAATANPQLQELTKLNSASSYAFLTAVEDESDHRRFQNIAGILESIGIKDSAAEEVWKLLAAVLHLGNIGFTETKTNSTCGVTGGLALQHAAAMLSVDEESLRERLTQRQVLEATKPLSVEECCDARDALAKALYSSMFDWLVAHMNVALGEMKRNSSAAGELRSLSVLDIFGFESFEKNSFEQLCINYCNEKLHSFFLEEIILGEMEVYKTEEISFPKIEFTNKGIVDTLENRGGVFSLLDEQTRIVRGSDGAFLNRIKHLSIAMAAAADQPVQALTFPSPKQVRNGASETAFTLRHYAGTVEYDADKFLSKNKDALGADLIGIAHATTSSFVRELLLPFETAKTARKTVAGQFRAQLRVLFQKLSSAEQHYIRTILPNDVKAAGDFRQEKVLEQLAYSGLLAVCKVRKLGFPFRRSYDAFFNDFSCLVANSATSADELVDNLLAADLLRKDTFARGKTSIFLRGEVANELQQLRKELVTRSAKTIQKVVRGSAARRAFRHVKEVLREIRTALVALDATAVKATLSKLPMDIGGGSIKLVLHELVSVEDTTILNIVLGSAVVMNQEGTSINGLRDALQHKARVLSDVESALLGTDLERTKALLSSYEDVLEGTAVRGRARSFVVEEEEKIREKLRKEEEERQKRLKEEEERKRRAEEEEQRRLLLEEEQRRKEMEEKKRKRELEEAARLRKQLSEQEKRSKRELAVITPEAEEPAEAKLTGRATQQEQEYTANEADDTEEDDEIEIIRPSEVYPEQGVGRIESTRPSEQDFAETLDHSSGLQDDNSEVESHDTSTSGNSTTGAESTMDRLLKPVKLLKARRKLRRALRVNEIIMLTTAIQYCKDHQMTKEPSLVPLIQETKSAILEILRQHKEQLRQEQLLKRRFANDSVMIDNVPLVR